MLAANGALTAISIKIQSGREKSDMKQSNDFVTFVVEFEDGTTDN